MLDDLIKYINNEDIKSEDNARIFLVLDTDLSEKRISEIKKIEERCPKNNILPKKMPKLLNNKSLTTMKAY